MTGIDENKLAGGKRKNGHSSDCTCHICENMINKAKRNGYTKDAKKKELQKKGAVKKNGHSPDCGCPICKNMMAKSKKQYKKQKGGDEQSEQEQTEQTEQTEQSEEPEQTEKQEQSGGKKKKGNGHKANCKCPICKNMKKSKKGGEDPDIENQKGDIEEGGIKGESETTASDSEYDDIDNIPDADTNADADADANAAELGEAGPGYKAGGTRKRRRTRGSKRKHVSKRYGGSKKKSNGNKTYKNRGMKKSNGHKPVCKCPICINMKK